MYWLANILGKITLWATRHLGGGHGSALPGLVAEKVYPKFLKRTLAQLPDGVILVSGTNGKTTTTKVIADLLRADGYGVFTNPSGSNYTRGVISAALSQMKWGKLSADIAVLELDEAYATHFVDQVRPKYSLLLNVLRDQLDRFGEIDHTAELLEYVANHTSDVVVLNEGDPRLKKLAKSDKLKADVAWFGYSGQASELYCTDEELHGGKKTERKAAMKRAVSLDGLKDNEAKYLINGEMYAVKLRLFGIHNALNCAAAMATVRAVEGDDFNAKQVMEHLGAVRPAFGRGEVMTVGDSSVRLVLVKNPSGFQLSLNSSDSLPTLLAINDAHADGRDVSWLWDVSFTGLNSVEPITLTGVRAYDMALRLEYDGVASGVIDPDIETAVKSFIGKLNGGEGQIFATYTAMLKIRDVLERMNND